MVQEIEWSGKLDQTLVLTKLAVWWGGGRGRVWVQGQRVLSGRAPAGHGRGPGSVLCQAVQGSKQLCEITKRGGALLWVGTSLSKRCLNQGSQCLCAN